MACSDPGCALPKSPEGRIFPVKFLLRIGHGRQQQVDAFVARGGGCGGPEGIAVSGQPLAHIAHQEGTQHVRVGVVQCKTLLRQYDASDAGWQVLDLLFINQSAVCGKGCGLVDGEAVVAEALRADVREQGHAEHQATHTVGEYVHLNRRRRFALGLCGGAHMRNGHRNIGPGHVFKGPTVACTWQIGAGAQV